MSAALQIYKAIDFLIRVEAGPDAGKLYRITPPKIDIGRDPALQIALNDPKASRKQCSIVFGQHITIKDCSSRKTTLVNGKPIVEQQLSPNDVIEFGTTKLRFIARNKQQANSMAKSTPGKPQAQSQNQNQGFEKKKDQRKPFYILLAIIVGLVGFLLLLPDGKKKAERKLTTTEELTRQVQESKDRQEELREAFKEKTKKRKKNYLFSVDQHFIRGFRDFMTGKYNRASQAFGTVRATDKDHIQANRYGRLAKKKHEDLIDAHMRDGLKYKDKLNFRFCEAEFKKAMILMNKPNHPKYKVAKAHMDECRLLKTGGY